MVTDYTCVSIASFHPSVGAAKRSSDGVTSLLELLARLCLLASHAMNPEYGVLELASALRMWFRTSREV